MDMTSERPKITSPLRIQYFPNVVTFCSCFSTHRYFGRRILLSLSSHPDFDKILEKCIPSKDVMTVRDIVFTLRAKVLFLDGFLTFVFLLKVTLSSHWRLGVLQGLGEMPQDTQSARGRRSIKGSGTVRASSLTREPLNQTSRWLWINTNQFSNVNTHKSCII